MAGHYSYLHHAAACWGYYWFWPHTKVPMYCDIALETDHVPGTTRNFFEGQSHERCVACSFNLAALTRLPDLNTFLCKRIRSNPASCAIKSEAAAIPFGRQMGSVNIPTRAEGPQSFAELGLDSRATVRATISLPMMCCLVLCATPQLLSPRSCRGSHHAEFLYL